MASNDIRERHERSESAAETLMDVFLFRNDICGAQRDNTPFLPSAWSVPRPPSNVPE